MKEKSFKAIHNISLVCLSVGIGLVLCEVIVRTVKPRLYRTDKLLGWSLKPNLSLRKNITSFKGRDYEAHFETDSRGFRATSYKDKRGAQSTRGYKTIFITGDSFTANHTTSNNDSWFGVLSKELDIASKVYSYAISGSGTTQQMLAFKRYKDIIKPDILIIQFCTNDPWNDSINYSKYSIVRNQDWRRPYLKDGNIVYNSETKHKLYRLLHSHSRLFQMGDYILQVLQNRSIGGYHDLSNLKPRLKQELKDESLEYWSKVYKKYIILAKTAGVNDIWSISCRSRKEKPKITDYWTKLSNELGVIPLESPADNVYNAESEGLDVRSSDGAHWSDIGHKIVGESVAKEMNEHRSRTMNMSH